MGDEGRGLRSSLQQALQQSIQLVGEGLLVARTEGRRAAGLHARRAQLFHEAAQGEALLDVVVGEALAARIEHMRAFLDGRRMSAVITRSPGCNSEAMRSSATSNPVGTWMARIHCDGGVRSI